MNPFTPVPITFSSKATTLMEGQIRVEAWPMEALIHQDMLTGLDWIVPHDGKVYITVCNGNAVYELMPPHGVTDGVRRMSLMFGRVDEAEDTTG